VPESAIAAGRIGAPAASSSSSEGRANPSLKTISLDNRSFLNLKHSF
jgi:hypothetical protein